MTPSKTIILVLVGFIAVGSMVGAVAVHGAVEVCTTESCTLDNPLGSVNDITGLICKFIEILATKLMPPALVVMVLLASFLFLTAAGQPGKIVAAKTTLIWAVIGSAVLMVSYPLVSFVVEALGKSTRTIYSCTPIGSSINMLSVFATMINWFSWALAILSVVMGLYAGFLYMTSRGEPQKTSKAHNVLFYTIVGILVAIIAFSIQEIVKNFVGA